ncbi:hypothetical protein SKA58_12537 [Sphingomonas sp. SKA58]|nr:hypothetical protein SKA58_12537 [Sphingomonas sp. SKA58]
MVDTGRTLSRPSPRKYLSYSRRFWFILVDAPAASSARQPHPPAPCWMCRFVVASQALHGRLVVASGRKRPTTL